MVNFIANTLLYLNDKDTLSYMNARLGSTAANKRDYSVMSHL